MVKKLIKNNHPDEDKYIILSQVIYSYHDHYGDNLEITEEEYDLIQRYETEVNIPPEASLTDFIIRPLT